MATLTHRLQEFVEYLIEELLAFHVTQATTTIVVLQLIKVLILRPELCKVFISGECIKVGEYRITLHMTRIIEVYMFWVGIH